jgi:O-antigen/teichoic acid export membrane protein
MKKNPFNKIWEHFIDDNLFRNSIYLMLNTVTMSGFGFVFWIICAHLYSPENIGIATSLISSMTLISYISLLGFDISFVKFLPKSKNRNDEINTGLTISILVAISISVVYVLTSRLTMPSFAVLNQNIFYKIGFIFLVGFATVNLLTDSVFIALRGAQFNLLIDGILMSSIKIFLPVIFIGGGAFGIFAASGSAATIAMIASFFFLTTRFDYKPKINVNKKTIDNIFHYSVLNYVGNLLNIAPTLTLPLIIINHLGPVPTGYYYLSFSVANLLYAVAHSIFQSLFTEGSYREAPLRKLVKRSVLILSAIMIPVGTIFATLGPYILRIFGKSYSQNSGQLISLLVLAAPAVAAYTLGCVLLRIVNKAHLIIIVNIIYASIISGLATYWANRGLTWIAFAWMLGNIFAALAAFVLLFPSLRKADPIFNKSNKYQLN